MAKREAELMAGCAASKPATNAALLPVMGKLRTCRQRQRTLSVKDAKFSGRRLSFVGLVPTHGRAIAKLQI